MVMRRRLACCTRDRQISFDFDHQPRITSYDGLESCITKRQQTHESGASLSDDASSSCSSSSAKFGSFSSKRVTLVIEKQGSEESDTKEKPCRFYVDDKPARCTEFSQVEALKEMFARLLLGEDVTGGSKGVTSALALSNAIVSLAASVFGEQWKLEPLAEERKLKWRTQMEWLLCPTNHMVELVPTKLNASNGQILEIMTPKSRFDIQMNLPALKKLDSMLIETLDSMVSTEFWYAEGGSRRCNGERGKSRKKWWLPAPRVPEGGLSDPAKKRLISQGKRVHQILKAAKSINQTVLLEMPVPVAIKHAFPKLVKANLRDDLYKALTEECKEIPDCLGLTSEQDVLEAINGLEAVALSWREKVIEAGDFTSPVRASWAALSFARDPRAEAEKVETLQQRAEGVIQQLKARHPNLPHSFLDAAKVRSSKDIGHSVMEAYSRVLVNLASNILCRIGDVVREDVSASSDDADDAVSDAVSRSTPLCFMEATLCSDSATSLTYSNRTSGCDFELN